MRSVAFVGKFPTCRDRLQTCPAWDRFLTCHFEWDRFATCLSGLKQVCDLSHVEQVSNLLVPSTPRRRRVGAQGAWASYRDRSASLAAGAALLTSLVVAGIGAEPAGNKAHPSNYRRGGLHPERLNRIAVETSRPFARSLAKFLRFRMFGTQAHEWLEGSVAARDHIGGTAPNQVRLAIARLRGQLNKN